MNKAEQVLDIISTMRETFESLAQCEASMDRCIKKRDHMALQVQVDQLYQSSRAIEQLEMARIEACGLLNHELGLPENASLKDCLPRLEQRVRERFVAEYRALTSAIMAVRSLSEGIDVYVSTQTAVLKTMVEAVVPGSKSRVYGRSGSLEGDRQPWLVSQHA